MNRSCLWLCTLTAAMVTTVADARAFTPHKRMGHVFARFIAGPELRGGPGLGGSGPPPSAIKPPAAPSGNYSFSGSSFNLSVTRNGRLQTPPPPPPPPPGGERPGFFQRMFNWW